MFCVVLKKPLCLSASSRDGGGGVWGEGSGHIRLTSAMWRGSSQDFGEVLLWERRVMMVLEGSGRSEGGGVLVSDA